MQNNNPSHRCPKCNGTGLCDLDEKYKLILDAIRAEGGRATCSQVYAKLGGLKLFKFDSRGRVKTQSLCLMHRYFGRLTRMGLLKKSEVKVKPRIGRKTRNSAWEFSLVTTN